MATGDGQTANYSWLLPVVGASATTWGTSLNYDLGQIDQAVFTNQTAIAAINARYTVNALTLNKAHVVDGALVYGQSAGVNRWVMQLGEGTAEGGANAGSNFTLSRYNDAGTFIDIPLTIARATGTATFQDALTVNGATTLNGSLNGANTNITISGTVQSSAIHSTGDTQVDGALTANGNITAGNALVANNGVYPYSGVGSTMVLSGSSTSRLLQFSSGWNLQWRVSDGLLSWNTPTGAVIQIDGSGNLSLETGNGFKPGGGPWAAISDDRTKKDVAPYAGGLDQILKLQPISYRYNGQGGTPNNSKTYYGLSAQAAKPVMPELVIEMDQPRSGVDGQPLPRADGMLSGQLGTELGPLTLALVNAVKTLTARVAVLEAAR
jgi:hypothetical protein